MDQIPSNFTSTTNQITDTGIAEVGGNVRKFTAGAALLIGDVVYLSAADTVNKSAVAADYEKFIGVVVGGKTAAANGSVTDVEAEIGLAAAAAGEWVLVQIDGIARVKSDGAILATSRIIADATIAGEVDIAGATGYFLGIALEAIPDGSVGRMLIRFYENTA